MKKILFTLIFSFLICLPAYAHQPHLVQYNLEPIKITDPEVSKAYYSELKGKPDFYVLDSPINFQLYLNILIPAVPETNRDMLVEFYTNQEPGKLLYTLDGKNFDWQFFHEEFANDDYYKGPEIREMVKAGSYYIKVSSPDNTGRYSLAVGEKEEFPPLEIIRSLIELPQIKSQIFNKPAISAFFNIFGLFIWLPLILLIVIIIGIVYLIKRRRRKK
jgi:hypothetical protein